MNLCMEPLLPLVRRLRKRRDVCYLRILPKTPLQRTAPAVTLAASASALLRIGWSIKRESGGSHRIRSRAGWSDYVFSFHDGEEIGRRMLPVSQSTPG